MRVNAASARLGERSEMDKWAAPMFLAQKARYPSMRGRRSSVGNRAFLSFARNASATRQAQASAWQDRSLAPLWKVFRDAILTAREQVSAYLEADPIDERVDWERRPTPQGVLEYCATLRSSLQASGNLAERTVTVKDESDILWQSAPLTRVLRPAQDPPEGAVRKLFVGEDGGDWSPLHMVGYETSLAVSPPGFQANDVTSLTSRPIATRGDGACALHALLGRHLLHGEIVCRGLPDVTESQLRDRPWYHARVYALRELVRNSGLFLRCARRFCGLDSKRDKLCADAKAELTRLESLRGALIFEHVKARDLCAEDSQFFLEMRMLDELHREMRHADFMPHVSPYLCNEGYKTCDHIRERVRDVAVADLFPHDEAVQRQTDAIARKQEEFYSSGKGGEAYRKKFVSRDYCLSDEEIEALAVAFGKRVLLVHEDTNTCVVMNPEATDVRVILQQGDPATPEKCHFSLLKQNSRTPP